MAIRVTLIEHTKDPIRALYMAFRVCYSALTPEQVLARIGDERISPEQMLTFVEARLQTGHVSPLEQVSFEFGISGVSRAFSHQFVRHRIGISFEQQSQRYVTYKGGEFPYTVPRTVERAGMGDEMASLFAEAGAPLREDGRGRRAGRGRALPVAQCDEHELQDHGQLRVAAAHRRPAALHACAVGVPQGRVVDARRGGARRAGAGPRAAAEMRGSVGWATATRTTRPGRTARSAASVRTSRSLFQLYDSYRKGELADLDAGDMEIIAAEAAG